MPCPICGDTHGVEKTGELSPHTSVWWCQWCDCEFLVMSLFLDDWAFVPGANGIPVYVRAVEACQDATH
jgi:hypothetical protein